MRRKTEAHSVSPVTLDKKYMQAIKEQSNAPASDYSLIRSGKTCPPYPQLMFFVRIAMYAHDTSMVTPASMRSRFSRRSTTPLGHWRRLQEAPSRGALHHALSANKAHSSWVLHRALRVHGSRCALHQSVPFPGTLNLNFFQEGDWRRAQTQDCPNSALNRDCSNHKS